MNTLANLESWGRTGLTEAAELLNAYAENNVPSWFYEDGVTIATGNDGSLFLTNSEYQILMIDDGKFYGFYDLSWRGDEGTAEDLFDTFKQSAIDSHDWEQLKDILEQEGMEDEAEAVQAAIDGRYCFDCDNIMEEKEAHGYTYCQCFLCEKAFDNNGSELDKCPVCGDYLVIADDGDDEYYPCVGCNRKFDGLDREIVADPEGNNADMQYDQRREDKVMGLD